MLTKEQMRELEEFVRADGQEWPGDPRRKQARQLYQIDTLRTALMAKVAERPLDEAAANSLEAAVALLSGAVAWEAKKR